MTNKENAVERIERLKREKAAAKEAGKGNTDLVGHLTHENNGEPNFAEIAKKLEERKAQVAKGENEGHVKMTIYVREDIADAFNALITKRGQQKQFINQALIDFIQKKVKELDVK